MAVEPEDIQFHLSIPSASAGMSDPQPDTDDSLGGYISTTEVVDATLHNLFDVITGDDNANEVVDYRCMFVRNDSADTLIDAVVWVQNQIAGGADAHIGLDPAGVSNGNSSSAQAAVIADENSAPSGVNFQPGAIDKGTALSIGDLTGGQVQAIWIRRTATNSPAQNLDGITIRVEGDTGE